MERSRAELQRVVGREVWLALLGEHNVNEVKEDAGADGAPSDKERQKPNIARHVSVCTSGALVLIGAGRSPASSFRSAAASMKRAATLGSFVLWAALSSAAAAWRLERELSELSFTVIPSCSKQLDSNSPDSVPQRTYKNAQIENGSMQKRAALLCVVDPSHRAVPHDPLMHTVFAPCDDGSRHCNANPNKYNQSNFHRATRKWPALRKPMAGNYCGGSQRPNWAGRSDTLSGFGKKWQQRNSFTPGELRAFAYHHGFRNLWATARVHHSATQRRPKIVGQIDLELPRATGQAGPGRPNMPAYLVRLIDMRDLVGFFYAEDALELELGARTHNVQPAIAGWMRVGRRQGSLLQACRNASPHDLIV